MDLDNKTLRQVLTSIKSIDLEQRMVTAIISTEAIDADGEVMLAKALGNSIESYMRNPVLIAGHKYIGENGEPTVIGSIKSMRLTADGWEAQAQLATTPLAEQYWALIRDGHIRGFSVGFIPKESELRAVVHQGQRKSVRHHTRVDLREISVVALPCNAQALAKDLFGARQQLQEVINAAVREALGATLRQMIDEAMRDAVGATLTQTMEKALKESLSPEPGSQLHMLLEDIAASMSGCTTHGDKLLSSGDVQQSALDVSAAEQKALEEASASLGALLGELNHKDLK